MISTCPSCLNRVDHRDDLKEVVCECGEKFATFYDAPKEEESLGELNKPSKVTEPSHPNPEESFDNSFSDFGQNNTGETFNESTNAFAEIRDFGEGLSDSKKKKSDPPPTVEEPSVDLIPQTPAGNEPAPVVFTPSANPAECLMTAASEFPGMTILEFLMPISVFAELGTDDPLKPAFQALSESAARQGANGVLGVHWNLTADKVLIAGTPVKIQK